MVLSKALSLSISTTACRAVVLCAAKGVATGEKACAYARTTTRKERDFESILLIVGSYGYKIIYVGSLESFTAEKAMAMAILYGSGSGVKITVTTRTSRETAADDDADRRRLLLFLGRVCFSSRHHRSAGRGTRDVCQYLSGFGTHATFERKFKRLLIGRRADETGIFNLSTEHSTCYV